MAKDLRLFQGSWVIVYSRKAAAVKHSPQTPQKSIRKQSGHIQSSVKLARGKRWYMLMAARGTAVTPWGYFLMSLLGRITILCSCGSFFCKYRIALSWARSAVTSACCLAGCDSLVSFPSSRTHTSGLLGWSMRLGVGILNQYLVCVPHIHDTPGPNAFVFG